MHQYTLSHLADEVLLRDLAAIVARDRATTAILLAHIAEVDARKLYVPEGYPSMHAYCVEELHLSEDAAYKRIQAARAARQFPVLFSAVADGRLHVTAVWLLAPHLTPDNVNELIESATHRRKSEIGEVLARRFPPRGVPVAAFVVPVIQREVRAGTPLLSSGVVSRQVSSDELVPEPVEEQRVVASPPQSERYLLQLTIGKGTLEKLRQAQALLSHAVPAGDPAQVFDRALDALIVQLEKRKFGSASGPSSRSRVSHRKRYVPASVRRAVWERDQGQCSFVGTNGKRCTSSRLLEYDHIEPLARGGRATVDGMRLRCRAHNQFEAEQAFGVEFMRQKRHERRLAAAEASARTAERDRTQDLLAGLRSLGCKADEARRAVEVTGNLHAATLEEHIRAALAFLGSRSAGRLPRARPGAVAGPSQTSSPNRATRIQSVGKCETWVDGRGIPSLPL